MSFTAETVEKVWQKATVVRNYDANKWRKDQCEAWIDRNAYGNRNSLYGWEIDHIRPVSGGGTDDLSNLRPLQWENNAATQDGRLSCVVTASGEQNVSIVRTG